MNKHVVVKFKTLGVEVDFTSAVTNVTKQMVKDTNYSVVNENDETIEDTRRVLINYTISVSPDVDITAMGATTPADELLILLLGVSPNGILFSADGTTYKYYSWECDSQNYSYTLNDGSIVFNDLKVKLTDMCKSE